MRRLFLTPPDLPTDYVCRTIKIPNDKLWLGIFNAALLQTLYGWNWEQVNDTDLTIEEATQVSQEIFYEYLDSGGNCIPLAPYWDEETGEDADGDDLASGFPWYENLADWAVSAFLAASFTPDAAIQYVTTIRKVRLWFRTRDYGAIVRVLVDGVQVGTVDTYSPEPGLVEFAYDIPESLGLMALAEPTGTIRIEHTGTANAEAVPTVQGYGVEVIRKRLDWEEGGGGGCIRQYRLNEDGVNQYSDNGGETWEDASDLPDYPEPTPRTEPTDEEKKCLAARNAVEVMRLTFIESFEQWEATGDVLDNIVTTSGFLATVLGLFIAATWISVWGFVLFVAGNVLKGFNLITSSDWTEDDTRRLTCRLVELATVQPDDTVTFDITSLRADGANAFGNVAVAAFYSLMLDTIGEAGLNAAGGTTAITEYDCEVCGDWCWNSDVFSDLQAGWDVYIKGNWQIDHWGGVNSNAGSSGTNYNNSVGLERSFAPTEITSISLSLNLEKVSAAAGCDVFIYDELGGTHAIYSSINSCGSPIYVTWTGSLVMSAICVWVNGGRGASPGTLPATSIAQINAIEIRGRGENPFGSSNC